jgi:hypothetical protein
MAFLGDRRTLDLRSSITEDHMFYPQSFKGMVREKKQGSHTFCMVHLFCLFFLRSVSILSPSDRDWLGSVSWRHETEVIRRFEERLQKYHACIARVRQQLSWLNFWKHLALHAMGIIPEQKIFELCTI